MSRIGKNPLKIASGVDVKVNGQEVSVKGPKGTLTDIIPAVISAKIENGQISFAPINDNAPKASAMWGLAVRLVNNMLVGVTDGYTKTLEIAGVGMKAAVQGKNLKLNLGFSHDVDFAIPDGLEIKTPKPTEIVITGTNKQQVGQVAAVIRSLKKPEPYKGKGIKYSTETIRRKEGKKK
jgi:large subunit ribosomal protein L6